jgi:hypothetical protein
MGRIFLEEVVAGPGDWRSGGRKRSVAPIVGRLALVSEQACRPGLSSASTHRKVLYINWHQQKGDARA